MAILNPKQKETMSQFYGNFALAWITVGLIGPVFGGVGDKEVFFVKLGVSLVMTFFSLSIALQFTR